MICFQAAHYLSFFRRVITKLDTIGIDKDNFLKEMAKLKAEASKGWTLFDDENVVSIGAWREVVNYCVKNRCYPTVILLEKLSLADEVPERS